MPSKQLEIIVNARDNATKAFATIGNSAQGLAGKLEGLNEAGHGMHKMMRQARNVAIAFEVIPVGVDAAKAAIAALTGTSQQSAEAQTALLESIKSLPVVGKLAGDAAETLGDKIATMFGKQTTAEIVADSKAAQAALAEFGKEVPKIFDDLKKSNFDASLLGLLPGDVEIAKAQEKYRDAYAKIFESKQKISAAQTPLQDDIDSKSAALDALKLKQKEAMAARLTPGAALAGAAYFDSEEESQRKIDKAQHDLDAAIAQKKSAGTALDALDAEAANDRAERDAAIAAANRKAVEEQRAFYQQLKDVGEAENNKLVDATVALNQSTLEANNKGYQARVLAIGYEADKRVGAIRDGAAKELAELGKQEEALKDAAAKGSKEAIERLEMIGISKHDVARNADEQSDVARQQRDADISAAKTAALRDAKLSGLQREADAGSAIARIELDRLTTARELEATENALQAIGDAAAINAKHKSDTAVLSLNLAQSELGILNQLAALGDTGAGIEANRLEVAKQREESEARLNALKEQGNQSQKDEADRQLAQLKTAGKRQTDNTIRDAGLFLLQQESALGDKNAERQLKKIELEKQFTEQREKALAVLKDDAATQKQKDDAKKAMSGIDAVEKAAVSRLSADRPNGQATMVDSQFLTGLGASASQEKDPYQPIVDAQNKGVDIQKNIFDLLGEYFEYLKSQAVMETKDLT